MKRMLLALLFGACAYAIAFASAATIGTVIDAGIGFGVHQEDVLVAGPGAGEGGLAVG